MNQRGGTQTMRRKRSTHKHCANGHPWTRDSVIIKRACLICNREQVAAYKERRAQSARRGK
jgi:hypothetical protein